MSTYNSFFNPYATQGQIESLQQQILNAPEYSQQLRIQQAQMDRLELVTKALVELIVSKQVATAAEIRVLMAQLDLEDGVEDGRISDRQREAGPRCSNCSRHLNPKREACVYCGTPMSQANPAAAPKPPEPQVECSACGKSVGESQSYYSGRGLVCGGCFDPNA